MNQRISVVVGVHDPVVRLCRKLKEEEADIECAVAHDVASARQTIARFKFILGRIENFKASIFEVGIICNGTLVLTRAIWLPLRALDLIPSSHVGLAIEGCHRFHYIASDGVRHAPILYSFRHCERGFDDC